MRTVKLSSYPLALMSLALLGGSACTDDSVVSSSAETSSETSAAGDGDGDDTDPSGTETGTDSATETSGTETSGDGDGDPATASGTETSTETSGDGDPSTSTETSGDGDGDGGSPLDEIPEEEFEPIEQPDGVPAPSPDDDPYADQGEADPNDSFRALIGLHLRNREDLEAFVDDVSDPGSDIYGEWMNTAEFMDNHAPTVDDFVLLQAWLEFAGFSVNYLATNRMLIQFSGTIGQFNEAFNTTVHVCMRENPQHGGDPFPVYCASDSMTLPIFVANRSPGVITLDLPAEVGDLPNEAGSIQIIPPPVTGSRLNPERVNRAYNIDALHDLGYDGTGQRIGVVMGAHIHYKWAQTFWHSWGIVRSNPELVFTAEDPVTRFIESQLDNTWAGAIAPGAELVGYEGPDAKNTAMVFAYNEATTRAQDDGVSVITNSFAHREDSEPLLVRNQYHDSSLVGAAMGITLLAATGDSAETDTPSHSPYVTGVGGTNLQFNNQGQVVNEVVWDRSGSGPTEPGQPMPWWQVDAAGDLGVGNRRVTADVSASGGCSSPYYVYYNSAWALYCGTSFSSPVWAGMIACVNQYREENGMAPIGYMNPMLYTTPAVQATFRDITQGSTWYWPAGDGYDPGTGWGTPDALAFAQTVPSP